MYIWYYFQGFMLELLVLWLLSFIHTQNNLKTNGTITIYIYDKVVD